MNDAENICYYKSTSNESKYVPVFLPSMEYC